MKRLFSLFTLFAFTSSFAPTHPFVLPKFGWDRAGSYVYMCEDNTLATYHSSKNCRALSTHTHEIIKVTEKEAKEKYLKKPCKFCE